MKLHHLHSWDVSPSGAVTLQNELRGKVLLTEGLKEVQFIAGADVSYSKGDDLLWAGVLVFTWPGLILVEEQVVQGKASFTYIPGLLTFREGPVLLRAFEKLKTDSDLILFDGQGMAHPRGMGIASHLGLWLGRPTLGCAKSRLVGKHDEVGIKAGSFSYLEHKGRVVGAALRTKDRVNPVYVSPGYGLSLEEAIEWTLKTCRGYRLPEPTRQAHLAVNRIRLQESKSKE
ncbi:deoxyribonuclease V [candidate division KSB1 bacterium]|nr:deoxyribonuclease V [candidate division KSB1 bacterium]